MTRVDQHNHYPSKPVPNYDSWSEADVREHLRESEQRNQTTLRRQILDQFSAEEIPPALRTELLNLPPGVVEEWFINEAKRDKQYFLHIVALQSEFFPFTR